MLAGGGLGMSGSVDREHSRCRCPLLYHIAKLKPTNHIFSTLVQYKYASDGRNILCIHSWITTFLHSPYFSVFCSFFLKPAA